MAYCHLKRHCIYGNLFFTNLKLRILQVFNQFSHVISARSIKTYKIIFAIVATLYLAMVLVVLWSMITAKYARWIEISFLIISSTFTIISVIYQQFHNYSIIASLYKYRQTIDKKTGRKTTLDHITSSLAISIVVDFVFSWIGAGLMLVASTRPSDSLVLYALMSALGSIHFAIVP